MNMETMILLLRLAGLICVGLIGEFGEADFLCPLWLHCLSDYGACASLFGVAGLVP